MALANSCLIQIFIEPLIILQLPKKHLTTIRTQVIIKKNYFQDFIINNFELISKMLSNREWTSTVLGIPCKQCSPRMRCKRMRIFATQRDCYIIIIKRN